MRVFQRLSNLVKHLSLEKCTRSLEKHTLMILAKMGYKSYLEEGVGVLPSIKAEMTSEPVTAIYKEGWALRSAKKAYRFNDNQKSYLTIKFQIGQRTGQKFDADEVARQMRRARGTDGERLFKTSEFLSPQQISSYFPCLSAAVRQHNPQEMDVQAAEEEVHFSNARECVSSEVEHPIIFDQYDLCAMASNKTLKQLKLGMLQYICTQLGLDIPQPAVRRKAPYIALLTDITSKCTCRLTHQT